MPSSRFISVYVLLFSVTVVICTALLVALGQPDVIACATLGCVVAIFTVPSLTVWLLGRLER